MKPAHPAQLPQIVSVDLRALFHLLLLRSVTLRYATVNRISLRYATFFVRLENAEFAALFNLSGWSQAEAARRLGVDRGTVSRYLAEDQEKSIAPSRPVVELFKAILVHERPAAMVPNDPLSDIEKSVIDQLRSLSEEDRERVVNALRAMTKGLPRVIQQRESNSSRPSSMEDLERGAAEEVKHPGVVFGRKRRVG